NDTASDSKCDEYFSKMDPVSIKFLSSDELADFKHPLIRIVMVFQGSRNGVKMNQFGANRRKGYTSYDIVCRGVTNETYKVIGPDDNEDWRRCLCILGGYKEYLRYPNGTSMNSDDEGEARSRYPGAFPTEKHPYLWLKKEKKEDQEKEGGRG
ncbi:3101_t:CDS:1, partial [Acaulospora colombiana]